LPYAHLAQLGWHLFGLKERDNQQEESVGAETAGVRIIETPNFKHLFQYQNQRLDQLVLVEVLFDKRNALETIMEVCHLRNVNLDGL